MKQLMQAKGLTVTELARRLQCDHSYISHILAGRRFPGWRYLERLASVLDVPPEYLYRILRDQRKEESA